LGALVIGGGVMAAANAESLGFLNIDFFPAQVSQLNSPAPSDGASASAPRNVAPAHAGSADPAPSGSAWTASGRVLQVAGADLALDWAGAPAGSNDKATDDSPHDPEFASISSPAGGAESLSAGHAFADAGSIAGAVGGGQSAAGGIGGGTGQAPSAPKAPDAANPLTDPSDDTLQAAAGPPLAAGPVPEPAAWVSMILGLGLTGAMLRASRRRRTA
jgi:hypothetical protein